MENYFAVQSGNRADSSQPSSSGYQDYIQQGQGAICWRGVTISQVEADQPQSKDKIDDVFSRMTLWEPPSVELNKRGHNELQRKHVSLSSVHAKPHLTRFQPFLDVPHQVTGAVASISPETTSKLYALKNQTINAEVLKMNTTVKGGVSGMASYRVDLATEIKIRFHISSDLKTNISSDRHRFVQGTLWFNDNDLNRLVTEHGPGIFKKAYGQKSESCPFYFVPKTIQMLPYSSELSSDQSFIFDHIKSLAGEMVTAELLRVNFKSGTAVAWYDFSTNGKTYGTPIACKLRSLPGHVNKPGEMLSIESSQPIYQVTGKVKIDEERLYKTVLENCPPHFTRKTADSPYGLPVYMVNDSLRVLPSECLLGATIRPTSGGKVIMKYF